MSGTLRDRLSRWSRLKAEAAAGTAEAETRESAAMPEDGAIVAEQQAADTPPDAAPELPDLATLTADSDYTVFLAAGVAEETRREALRILWRSDPVLANLSGLNDYDDDYRAIGTVQEVVETVYKAGAGYLEQLAAAADAETEDAAPPPAQGEEEAEAGEQAEAADGVERPDASRKEL
ncbi:conserved hypothetical protein [Candidatus Defluviicoccus seviourii]|uniref:DUF3306 domain-containing protein n=2 Tax=root TaxID=1 RepID=A0A564WGH8_9PROT|nr:conserved hypothetical protein [uncultured Defluviicoccus sp.]VUX47562.1 conserved hypothetical protein [Candidatus Defluviicoccus seviourii]